METDLYERLQAALRGRYDLVPGTDGVPVPRGRGGMATLWLARDRRHDREVAIKLLHPELVATLGRERFEREIHLVARLQHPHIVPLFDSGTAGPAEAPLLWYAMPFIAGETLRARMERERQLPVAEALRLAREAADALAYAHRHGVVHRDVKPENILLEDGHALVADFGVARAPVAEGRLTAAGLVVGTAGYMSPEQATGERELDGRADQYALACVLYEMLVGEVPLRGPTAGATLARRCAERPPSARLLRSAVPQPVDVALRTALAPLPADRFPDMREFAAALGAGAGRRAPGARRVGMLLAALLAAAAAAVLGIGLRRHAAPPPSTALTAPAPAREVRRIAVLPFPDPGGDTADRYLADGLTDELIGELSRVHGLRVIARASVAPYRQREASIAEIGRALGVGAVLDGSVRRVGERVQVSVQLVDVATQEERWRERYDREWTDVLAIQHDVARRVADALEVELRAAGAPPAGSRAGREPVDYDLYLRGRFYAGLDEDQRDSDSAVALFERLTRVDPAFAPGWAALAQAYTERLFQYDPDPRWQERAFVAIERALALDSTLAEAYAARAQLLWTDANGFRAEQAIRDYRRALRANPNLVEAHAGLGRIYMHVCLPDEALVHLRTALALDPASRFAPPRIAGVHLLQGRNDSALAGLEAVDDPSWTAERAAALLRLGRAADAERLLAQAAAASPPPELAVQIAGARSHVLAALGRAAEARRQIRLAQAGERFSHFHHQAFQVAAAWVHLGEADSAMTWLERSAAEGLPCHTLFAREPALAPLHALPRYQALLERLRGERERLRLVSRE